jgi:hypothetical protein
MSSTMLVSRCQVVGPTRPHRMGLYAAGMIAGVFSAYALDGGAGLTAPGGFVVLLSACAFAAGVSTLWSP